jgi:thioesterase domain-containing protein
MTPRGWARYVREKARYRRESRIANKMRFRQAGAPQGDDAGGENMDPRLAKLEYVYNTNLKALSAYKTEYYNGTITLFNAEEKDPALVPDPQYGWVGLAKKVEIVEVPGNHDTMLFEPNVSVLAERLNAALHSARLEVEKKK